jgi:hypothetical protein
MLNVIMLNVNYAEFRYAECQTMLSFVILNGILFLTFVTLNVILLSVIKLNVTVLSLVKLNLKMPSVVMLKAKLC